MEQLELEACRVDLVRGWVARGEVRVQLSSRELDLLRHLASHPAQVLTRDALLTQVWGYSDAVVSRACDQTISRLRAKIEGDPANPTHLLTVYGEGYRFELARACVLSSEPTTVTASAGWALGERTVDLARLRVVGPGGEVPLTAQEAQLLQRLHAAAGAIVDRQTLLRDIWGQHTGTRALDSAVRRLRTKLEPEPSEPRYLLTERGGGYRLELPRPALPAPAQALVGRVSELGELSRLVATERWVLVTGPGGIGKTRLLRQLAAVYSGNLLWVDLAQADTLTDAVSAVARALALEPAGDARELVARVLSRRQGLLVLDNLEQVAHELAPLIASWRQAAPGLVLVGSSRVRLGVDGEAVLELPGLPLDDAVALLLARARATWPSLRLRPEQDELVRELVQRLDGMPLAIELAAARLGALGLQALLDRLDRSLDLLARPRAEQDRHRSLRAVLAGSWELLEPEAAAALLLLSRFRSGFTVEDAEGLLGDAALDLLQLLRDHSLVSLRDDGRFGIFESIRLFADEQRALLPDGGRESDLRWVRWMARLGDLDLLRTLWFKGNEALARRQRAAVEDLERAADVALGWGEPELAAQTLHGAGVVRSRFGPHKEMLARLDRMLATAAFSDPSRARLLTSQAILAFLLDDTRRAVQFAEQALDLAPADALETQVQAYALLGRLHPEIVQKRTPQESLDRAAELYTRMGRPDLATYYRVFSLDLAKEPAAPRLLEEARRMALQLGDLETSGLANQSLAYLDEDQGRLGLSVRRHRENFEQWQAVERSSWAVHAGMHVLRLMTASGEREGFELLGERLLALIERTASREDEAQCWSHQTWAHTLEGRLGEAREASLRAWQALADCGPATRVRGYLELREAALMLALSDPASAGQLAEAGLARVGPLGLLNAECWGRGLLGCSLAERGRPEEALVQLDHAVQRAAELVGHTPSLCRLYRGRVRAATGDRAGALQDLAEGEALAARWGFHRPDSAPGLEIARLRTLLGRL